MTELFLKIVDMSIVASIIAAAIMLVELILKKAPKRMLLALWVLVAFRLICPFSFESSTSLIPRSLVSSVPEAVNIQSTDERDPEPGINTYGQQDYAGTESSEQFDAVTPRNISLRDEFVFALSIVWIAGIAVFLLIFMIRYRKLGSIVKKSPVYDGNIRLCRETGSSFVYGIIKPQIVISDRVSSEDVFFIIEHENTHIRRSDHIKKIFAYCLASIYWFNPVIWLSFRLFGRDVELVCDEVVLERIGLENKKSYAKALINSSVDRKTVAEPILAFSERKTKMKGRINNILHYKKKSLWTILAVVIVGICLIMTFIANPVKEANAYEGKGSDAAGIDKYADIEDTKSADIKVIGPDGINFTNGSDAENTHQENGTGDQNNTIVDSAENGKEEPDQNMIQNNPELQKAGERKEDPEPQKEPDTQKDKIPAEKQEQTKSEERVEPSQGEKEIKKIAFVFPDEEPVAVTPASYVFWEDENYTYSFANSTAAYSGGVKPYGDFAVVTYTDGTSEKALDALEAGRISISDMVSCKVCFATPKS